MAQKKNNQKLMEEKKAKQAQLRIEFYDFIDTGKAPLRESVIKYRKMLGMNQRDFAKWAEVPPRTLMAFEQGRGNPTLETVKKMLKGSGLELKVGRKTD